MKRNYFFFLFCLFLFILNIFCYQNDDYNYNEESTHQIPQTQFKSIKWFKSLLNNNNNLNNLNNLHNNNQKSYFKLNETKLKLNYNLTNEVIIRKVEKFSYGLLMGYSSGICLKKISKVAAVIVGGLFITIQSLSYRGYLKVDHQLIRKDFETAFDFNKDNEVNLLDIKAFLIKLKEVLSNGVAEGGGFTTGFVMGLRA